MKIRIQKVLSAAGVDSRRKVEQLVRGGRVSVNGRIVRNLPVLVDPSVDKIDVDGQRVKVKEQAAGPRIYILMNKPKGVYCTNVAQGVQRRAIDLLPPEVGTRVYPVGRLDAESKGLLLLTNDGDLTNRLTHPRFGVKKTYRAVVDGLVSAETLERLQNGVWLAERRDGPASGPRSSIKVIHRDRHQTTLEVTVRESRNRQVRPMLAHIGHKVRELTRIAFGPLKLEGIGVGKARPLTPGEVRLLQSAASARLADTPAAKSSQPPRRPRG